MTVNEQLIKLTAEHDTLKSMMHHRLRTSRTYQSQLHKLANLDERIAYLRKCLKRVEDTKRRQKIEAIIGATETEVKDKVV